MEEQIHIKLVDEQRRGNVRVLAAVRLPIGLLLVVLGVFGALQGRRDALAIVPLSLGYVAFGAMVYLLSRRTWVGLEHWHWLAVVDGLTIFVIQYVSIPLGPNPLSVAMFTTAVFGVSIVSAPLTLRGSGVVGISVLAVVLESLLVWAAGGDALDLLSVVVVLGFSILVSLTVLKQFDEVLRKVALEVALHEQAAEARVRDVEALYHELRFQVELRSRELGARIISAGPRTLPQHRLTPGTTFAERYRVDAFLGQGGMGQVYRVVRLSDQVQLALKVLVGDDTRSGALRFTREAELAARLRHPNLVPVLDVGMVPDGPLYLVMELVEGGTLEEKRHRFGDLRWGLWVLADVARGLAAVHAAGVMHRDLKPSNVLLQGSVARLTDFGVARMEESAPRALSDTVDPDSSLRLTRTGALVGTPKYMAPELVRQQEATRASDLYAFGLMAFEVLTGQYPLEEPPFVAAQTRRPLINLKLSERIGDEALAWHLYQLLDDDPALRPDAPATLALLEAALQRR